MVAPACPAVPGTAKARLEAADLFRRFGPSYLRRVVMTPAQGKVLRYLIACRTPALGGHIDTCDECGGSWQHYNSCRDRHCPTCQGWLALKWIAERFERFVETHHFHVVATVPEELRPVALAIRRVVYDLLFAAVSETLLELARDRRDALPAVTAVLHTWTRQMTYHPHLHCIVSGGGLSSDDRRWVSCKPDFLFPVRVMSALIRGKFMDGLLRANDRGTSAHLADPDAFAALRRTLYDAEWVVYAKPPFGDFHELVRYLSRYTHRVAISSSRLVSIADDAIVFRTHGEDTCRLHPDELIRRFLLHVLPHGFRKIRHYGLLALSNVPTRLPIAQRLARVSPPTRQATPPRPHLASDHGRAARATRSGRPLSKVFARPPGPLDHPAGPLTTRVAMMLVSTALSSMIRPIPRLVVGRSLACPPPLWRPIALLTRTTAPPTARLRLIGRHVTDSGRPFRP